MSDDYSSSQSSYNKMFKCPTIGFTCQQRQLYSDNGSVPFPVCQTGFSVPIETFVIYKMEGGDMVFNATLNNIPVISWQSVSLVEETGVRRENQRPAAVTDFIS